MNNTTVPDNGQNCSTIEPNPDIIGVGIRISLYILSLAGPIVGFIIGSPEFTAAVDHSLGVTGIALFLTTVVFTSQGTIDLFHAVCIFHLLGLVGISITPKSTKGNSTLRVLAFQVLYFLALGGALSYLTYVFARAPTFGSRPECNSTIKYVLFGINISATNAVIRWIFVASFGSIMLGYLIFLLVAGGVLCCAGSRGDFDTGSNDAGGANAPRGRKPFWHVVGHEIGCVYVIVMLELIIKRNALGPGTNDWTFGQILAMMMLAGPLIELLSSLLGGERP